MAANGKESPGAGDLEDGKFQLGSMGATPEERIKNTIAQKHVVVFGRSACPFTIEAVETFKRLGVEYTDIMMDQLPKDEHSSIHAALKAAYKQTSVPYIFVGGEFIGGCDDMKGKLGSGELMPKLYVAMKVVKGKPKTTTEKSKTTHAAQSNGTTVQIEDNGSPDPEELIDPRMEAAATIGATKVHNALFWFPELVDGYTARIIAFITMVICILSIIFREHAWAHWMMLGLFVDAVTRFFFGGGPSPIGQFSKLFTCFNKPHFVPGVPKQFAASVASMFAGLSALFFLLSFDDNDNIAGCVFAGVLAFFAMLESVFDWCAGCFFFGLAVRYGILPNTMYTVATNSKAEAEYAYNESVKKVDLIPCEVITKPYPGHEPSNVDLKYKTKKTDDSERQERDPIKHTKISHFQISLGLIGLAVVWKVAANSNLSISENTTKALQIITTVIFCLQILMYAAKMVMYPQKVRKEWQDPVKSNAFSIPPIILIFLAYCINGEFDNSETLAKVLYWIGTVLAALLAIEIVAGWIADRKALDHINSSWLIPPVGLLCAALVGPGLDDNYLEASYFWFGFGAITWIFLAPVLFYKAVVFVDADDRVRPLIFIWIAPPAIAFLAFLELTGEGLTFISRTFYFSSLALGFILGWLFMKGHLTRWKFDVTAGWAYAFPVDALAAATIVWASLVPGSWPNGMAYAALVISSAAVLICTLQTLVVMLNNAYFVTDPKYGPLSQQKLTHEAFRQAMTKLKTSVNALDPSYDSPMFFADFARQFRLFHFAHLWHSTQEDLVIFKNFDDFAPSARTAKYREDHKNDRPMFERWENMVAELENGADKARRTAVIEAFQKELPALIDELTEHLDGEEIHLQIIGRKYMPVEIHKQIMCDIWKSTPASVWEQYLPWIVNNLPTLGMRVKFLRCWLWAMPERCQMIGRMIATNVDPVTWARLKQWMPELAPRGDPDHRRYF